MADQVENDSWNKQVKNIYDDVVDLVEHIITKTFDSAVEIIIRSLPVIAPAPNALNLYLVAKDQLHFEWFNALLFAATIEFCLFGPFETTQVIYSRYLRNPSKYKIPLWILIIVSVIVLSLVVYIVWTLDSAHRELCVLPLFSAGGMVVLAIRRWNANEQEQKETEQPVVSKKVELVRQAHQPKEAKPVVKLPKVILPSVPQVQGIDDERDSKIIEYFTLCPGGNQRKGMEFVGCSLNTFNVTASRLAEDGKLFKNEDGKYFPIVTQVNGIH